ncbi:Bifunctional polymyxin resistance protein ArnA [Salinivirga cyanobacteriivorans]|uniref:Bifunctional polymyxin resistance protein ArnA n=1 Tax=Salinivirga cyanobacteriivorans TaxID=1307839 RepID=A0A0S2I0B6_9BACT|nr:formyltransferase family protein [Salinivirga cyanobacteriivorans]ALO15784.1 Bifunctional polymyxin resistance protein ArnA [Salinivirga cyanobacteriivorans]
MRIFIITMDDPVQTRDFIKYIIDQKKDQIVGLAVSKGDRLTIGKKRSKFLYIISLFLIMGISGFLKNSWITVFDKVRKKLSKYGLMKDKSILEYVKSQNIPTWEIKTPNSKKFLSELKEIQPDIIINQSQSIIKKDLLELPNIGVLNRHNALLPKNRGRLTPFWVLYKQEKETGVSIHFVEEGIDSGDIVVQKKYAVSKKDSFNSLVKKNYQIAPKAMVEAIEMLEKGNAKYIENDDSKATYNTIPTLKQAWTYRKRRLFS